ADIARLAQPAGEIKLAFDLPWPWGGERFELPDVRAINFIIGPLGSGKTRLAMRIAETLPGASFLCLDRASQVKDDAQRVRIDPTRTWLRDDGATAAGALLALLAGLEAVEASAIVVDVVERGLDHATQEALIAYLRRRRPSRPPLFLLTRSSAILDLAAV